MPLLRIHAASVDRRLADIAKGCLQQLSKTSQGGAAATRHCVFLSHRQADAKVRTPRIQVSPSLMNCCYTDLVVSAWWWRPVAGAESKQACRQLILLVFAPGNVRRTSRADFSSACVPAHGLSASLSTDRVVLPVCFSKDHCSQTPNNNMCVRCPQHAHCARDFVLPRHGTLGGGRRAQRFAVLPTSRSNPSPQHPAAGCVESQPGSLRGVLFHNARCWGDRSA